MKNNGEKMGKLTSSLRARQALKSSLWRLIRTSKWHSLLCNVLDPFPPYCVSPHTSIKLSAVARLWRSCFDSFSAKKHRHKLTQPYRKKRKIYLNFSYKRRRSRAVLTQKQFVESHSRLLTRLLRCKFNKVRSFVISIRWKLSREESESSR